MRNVAHENMIWEKAFLRLKAYKRRHGDCNVPRRYREDPYLAGWVRRQRIAVKTKGYNRDWKRRLNAVGFAWNTIDYKWRLFISKLSAYKRRHGDCNVPQNWKDRFLAMKVQNARRHKWRGDLPHENEVELTRLGLDWNFFDGHWNRQFKRLQAYKKAHGDCNVPCRWTADQLGRWVNDQRMSKKRKQLSSDRIRLLNEIGFVWEYRKTLWERRYKELQEYKSFYGNCDLPYRWPGNRQLSFWVRTQRYVYRLGQMPPDRIRRLNDLAFTW